jgi:hypothetical protein
VTLPCILHVVLVDIYTRRATVFHTDLVCILWPISKRIFTWLAPMAYYLSSNYKFHATLRLMAITTELLQLGMWRHGHWSQTHLQITYTMPHKNQHSQI